MDMMKWQEIMGHLCDVIMHTQHIQGRGKRTFPPPYFSRPHHEEIFLFMMRSFCIFLLSHHMSMVVRIIKHIEPPPLSHNGAKGDLSWIQKTKELGCWICMNG